MRHKSLAILIGDPVGHSLSPALMQSAMAAAGLDMTYLAMRVESAHLAAAIDGMHALGIVGANVTIPHKERVMAYLDDLTPTARAVGAVNTIFRDSEGRFIGENTDVAGFTAPLRGRETPAAALVLGTGGAARAAAFACTVSLGVRKVLVTGRTAERAERLVAELIEAADLPDHAVQTVPWEEREQAVADCALVVNTTPLGMTGHTDASPLPDTKVLTDAHLVYDLVYTPNPTRLLRDAAARGARTLGGLDMLLGQAAAAFRLWTGHDMDMDAARAGIAPYLTTP